MNPYENESAFESIIYGSKKSPGQVTLSGHDRDRNWDIAAAKGQSGATTTLLGNPIGKFEASFYLVRDFLNDVDEFTEWDEFQRALDASTNGPEPKAFPIYHPDLTRNGFTEVAVESVGGMIHDGRGGAIVKVRFLEHRPPRPKPTSKTVVKPGAGTNAGGGGGGGAGNQPVKPDPNQAAKDELAGLLEEAKAP